MAASETNPSVPAIIYLYANMFIPRVHFLAEGTQVPCTNVRVQTEPLAIVLFASAFWSLGRQGIIDMELVERRRFFGKKDVRILLLDRRDCRGLEGAIVANLADEGTIHEVICHWAESGSTNPWHDVTSEAANEAIAEGLIQEVKVVQPALTRLLTGEKRLRPVCNNIAAYKGRCDALARSWREFQARDWYLYDAMYRQCRRSLRSCAEYWTP